MLIHKLLFGAHTLSSFQGVEIEVFHHIQRCPLSGYWNRGTAIYREVSSFQGMKVPLYTNVSSFCSLI